jgi:signal transduction histidine kinase
MTALRDESGNLFGFVEIVRDITEKKKADDERLQLIREQEARAQAELALAARDEFLAILSHELRNPLGAISNALAFEEGQVSARSEGSGC